MSNLQEVPTDELLSFHDYPVVHQNSSTESDQAQINVTINDDNLTFQKNDVNDPLERDAGGQSKLSSIWSLDYYQRFFDVDTKDVTDRILASMNPKSVHSLGSQVMDKPDLYGPFWIATTLVFTIAISGNISSYLQYQSSEYHWRYDFKLVSYAATAIWMYVLLVPISIWGILKWSTETFNEENFKSLDPLELVCIYGYSLFIYIPVSILWTIQYGHLQWFLAIISALLSGSVLLLTLTPFLRVSRHKVFLTVGIIVCHFILAAGFMLCFFHTSDNVIENKTVGTHTEIVLKNVTTMKALQQ